MAFRNRLLASVLLSVLTFSSGLALAQSASPAPEAARARVHVNVQADGPAEAERADNETYVAALNATQTGGFTALQTHVPALTEAMNRAPATYPVMQEIPGGWLIRADDRDEIVALAHRISGVESARGGGEIKVIARPNVYPNIAFLLGSAAVDRRDFAAAHAVLDRALALQPFDRMLLNEKLVALHGERRWDEAYLLVKAALASGDPLIEVDPGSLQRRLGYTLIELDRLHEARAAYEASLVSDPGNATALAELQTIADLEAGHQLEGDIQISAPNLPAQAVKADAEAARSAPE
ncbi:hypothetical protein [Brevundimonas sp.]|uniref:hypothetical protein n=1 Tax=Brevundimonas sp. TaxID=1871086 RepID=UPI0025BE19CA|nr:hypothetical protein [Brevundimonas sp.]